MSAQVAADLRAAADLIERDGWTQELYEDTRGRRCQAGALIVALGGHAPTGSTSLSKPNFGRYQAAQAVLTRHLNDGAIGWNDDPGRTAEEVIAALRAAADRAEAEQ